MVTPYYKNPCPGDMKINMSYGAIVGASAANSNLIKLKT